MIENKKSAIGDKEITELEQTLVENLNIYRGLIKRINLTQPKLSLTAILKRDICWIIGILEHSKQDGRLINYKMSWAKNTLRIVCVKSRKEIVIIIINLIRKKLFHKNFTNNIHVRVIGVNNGQL